jgi:DNA-binding MarR family transcriptional regulator
LIENDTCGALIRQIHNALEKRCNNQLHKKDITLSQISTLIELINSPAGKLTFKELEKRLLLAQSTTAGLISRLEQKQLVLVSSDTEDKRIKYVELTKLGKKYYDEAKQEMDQTEKELLGNLTYSEKKIFLSLLQKVNEKVSNL